MIPIYETKEVLVQIENICLQYGDKIILKNVNGTVKNITRPDCTQGQIVGILGPSGRGKTSLARILAGLRKPTSGKVTVRGGANGEMIPVEAGMVGVVAQNYPLLDHRTVLGNLFVAARNAGLNKKDALDKINFYLEKFGLQDKKDSYATELSGGQKQRVAVIQQLLCSDHFIILDECTASLDLLAKERICQFVVDMSHIHEYNTFFMISHDVTSMVNIADYLWCIGCDYDEKGVMIPGAYIKKEYNLIDLGIAWQSDNDTQKMLLVREIKELFHSL